MAERRRRPRSWRYLVAALRDPQRSDFAFVPHHYVFAPPELADASLSPSESTPINSRSEYACKRDAHQTSGFFLLHVSAAGFAGVCCAWLALFPISPARLYNMQVDVFHTDHAHTEFFFRTCLYLGNILGAAAAGYLGDRLGRAGTLELAAIPFILGWVLLSAAYGELTVLAGRYLLGGAAGMISVVVPVYLAEVCAAQTRGRVICVQALLAAAGRLAYLALGGLFVSLSRQYMGFNLSEWKILALCGLLPCLALLLCAQKLPDSPTWLLARHDDRDAAFDVLYRLFDCDERVAEHEANAIIHAQVLARRDRRRRGAFFRPVLLCGALATLRAVCGFLVEPSISPTVAVGPSTAIGGSSAHAFVLTIFGVAVDGAEDALLVVVTAMAVTAAIGMLVCFFLVDTRGRLTALRGGCYVASAACAFLLLSIYRSTQEATPAGGVALSDSGWAALLLLTAGYELGLGVVPVVLLSELFAVRQRLGAVSLVVIWEAIVNLALAQALPALRSLVLVPTSVLSVCTATVLVCSVAGLAISWLYVPETSGRSLQEIEAILSGWQPATPRRDVSSRITLDYGSAGSSD